MFLYTATKIKWCSDHRPRCSLPNKEIVPRLSTTVSLHPNQTSGNRYIVVQHSSSSIRQRLASPCTQPIATRQRRVSFSCASHVRFVFHPFLPAKLCGPQSPELGSGSPRWAAVPAVSRRRDRRAWLHVCAQCVAWCAHVRRSGWKAQEAVVRRLRRLLVRG